MTKRVTFYIYTTLCICFVSEICNVLPIKQAPLYYLFVNDAGTMYATKQFLHFTDGVTNYQYVNKTTIRGFSVNMWRGCIYLQKLQSTMTIDWYFSGE